MELYGKRLADLLEAIPGFESLGSSTTELHPDVGGVDEPLTQITVLLKYRGERTLDEEFVRMIAKPLREANRGEDWYVKVGMQYIDKEKKAGDIRVVRAAFVEWTGTDPRDGLRSMKAALELMPAQPPRHKDPRSVAAPQARAKQPDEPFPRKGMFYDIDALPPGTSRKDLYAPGQIRDFTDVGEDQDVITLPLWGADPRRNMPGREVALRNRPRPQNTSTRITGGAERS